MPSIWWPENSTRVRTEHGNQAIQAGYYGWAGAGRFRHAQRRMYRFPNSIGGYAHSPVVVMPTMDAGAGRPEIYRKEAL